MGDILMEKEERNHKVSLPSARPISFRR